MMLLVELLLLRQCRSQHPLQGLKDARIYNFIAIAVF
jgi:hypothetical protein